MKTNFLISTKNGHKTLPSTLTSILLSTTNDFKLIIYDNSEVGIFDETIIGRLLAALSIEEIQTQYHRQWQPDKNIAEGRYNALKLIDSDCEYVGFIDDDVIPKPNAIENLIKCRKANKESTWIQGILFDTENVRAYKDYYNPIFNEKNHKDHKHQWQYSRWESNIEKELPDSLCCNTGFILFNRKMLNDINAFGDFMSIGYPEDNWVGHQLEKKFKTKGLLCTSAFAYHVPAKGVRRWNSQTADEQLNELFNKIQNI